MFDERTVWRAFCFFMKIFMKNLNKAILSDWESVKIPRTPSAPRIDLSSNVWKFDWTSVKHLKAQTGTWYPRETKIFGIRRTFRQPRQVDRLIKNTEFATKRRIDEINDKWLIIRNSWMNNVLRSVSDISVGINWRKFHQVLSVVFLNCKACEFDFLSLEPNHGFTFHHLCCLVFPLLRQQSK